MSEALAVVENPFRSVAAAVVPSGGTMAAAVSSREIAEVQTAMYLARQFPRNEVEVVDKILQACTRPSLAEAALYEYARGGTDIRGPSIRLAECIAQYWGHIQFGWRVLEESPGRTKVEAFAWDMQTGSRSPMTFDVTHERMAQGHKKILVDPRDIYEHVANNASRRLRACILRVIPGDVVEAAQQQCERTLKTKVEVTPERIANMVAQFGELGVTKAQVEKRIQRRVDAITPGLLMQLGKIYTSMKDGMSQPGDWFPPETVPQAVPGAAPGAPARPEAPTGRQAVKERLAARRTRPAPDPEPELYPHAHPDTDPGPVPDEAYELTPPTPADPVRSSEALLDVVRFARAAQTQDDIARVRHIALQLTEETEVTVAQQHIDAAVKRIG